MYSGCRRVARIDSSGQLVAIPVFALYFKKYPSGLRYSFANCASSIMSTLRSPDSHFET
jgi:hypothetical protein